MANDIFGGLFKGLSSFMPQDDPDVQLLTAQGEINDLTARQQELYAEIGKKMLPSLQGNPQFENIIMELRDVERRLDASKEKLEQVQRAKDEKARQDREKQDALTCPNCGTVNPEGMKFCQECGSKLGTSKLICKSCGAEQPQGTRFCGECGSKF